MDIDLGKLRALSEGLLDAKKSRVSTVNRAKHGNVADQPFSEKLIDISVATEKAWEDLLIEEYERSVPQVVQDWAKTVPGMATGALFPRLIGMVGNPRVAYPFHWEINDEGERVLVAGEPYVRGSTKAPNPNYGEDSEWHYGLRSFWQWCGCGDPQTRPKKGATQEELLRGGKLTTVRPVLRVFSDYLVRMRARSEGIANSKYLLVYDQARAEADSKRHAEQCQNHNRPPRKPNGCGTVARPDWGEPGSPWRPGHRQAHAHRMVHKDFLRDLYAVWPAPGDPGKQDGAA